ncbi:hypothetical protein AHAS_Ahas02G0190800 [Arachis hypogaea]
MWKAIWEWKGPERIKTFMWQLSHNRLLTAKRRARIMGTLPFCHLCPQVEETALHVLRDCPSTARIWSNALQPNALSVFFTAQLETWIDFNLNYDLGQNLGLEWKDFFMTTTWWVWRWRNQELVNRPFQRPTNAITVIKDYEKKLEMLSTVIACSITTKSLYMSNGIHHHKDGSNSI